MNNSQEKRLNEIKREKIKVLSELKLLKIEEDLLNDIPITMPRLQFYFNWLDYDRSDFKHLIDIGLFKELRVEREGDGRTMYIRQFYSYKHSTRFILVESWSNDGTAMCPAKYYKFARKSDLKVGK